MRQSPEWLDSQLVAQRVGDPGHGEQTEMPHRRDRVWVGQQIEDPKEDEDRNVLNVVQMVAGEKQTQNRSFSM